MKPYLILKDFKGSQDGFGDGKLFHAGQVAELSDSLAQALGGVSGGYIREASKAAEEIAAAPAPLADAVLETIAEAGNPAETRETKVIGPAETKVVEPEEEKADETVTEEAAEETTPAEDALTEEAAEEVTPTESEAAEASAPASKGKKKR